MKSEPGKFIVFEGLDGTGKSYHAETVAKATGALYTFEPGDTAAGQEIRKFLLTTEMPAAATALMMIADRIIHTEEVIKPTLASGRDVICDRYSWSTLAYQGWGEGLDNQKLEAASNLGGITLVPDAIFYFHNDNGQKAGTDIFESREVEYFADVKEGYNGLIWQARVWNTSTVETIDTSRSVGRVTKEVYAKVIKYINRKGQ